MPPSFRIALAPVCLLLVACTGYQLGGSKPSHLLDVSSIHVSLTKNQTQLPRASAHAANALVDAFTQDGTYRVTTLDTADARLETQIDAISYRQVRASRRDTLSSEELEMTLFLSWSLVDAQNPLRILEEGRSRGSTRFFLDPNLQTARQTALPDALERAAESLVARLADGF